MKHFTQIASGIDVSGINAALAAHPELWDQFTVRKIAPDSPHTGMSDIWVRYNDVRPYLGTGNYRDFNDRHVPVWYPAFDLLPVRDVIFQLMAHVGGEMLGGVLITRIPDGCGIDPHIDSGWHVEYYDKFYLSLQSAPGAEFHCEHEGVHEALSPAPGDIHLFDNKKKHWVTNTSGHDRITMIICIRTQRERIHE